ncbi:MAG: hypothetical protein JEY91_14415 [Spirochaetaceae bacterium]|nr:hypothetical protein [Spirochaetaceae bacterium]
MKTLRLFFFLLLSFSLSGQCVLDYQYGVSYPRGIFTGLSFNCEYFLSSAEINYSKDTFSLNRAFLTSDYLSLGSVTFSGLLRDMRYENSHFYSAEDDSRAVIDKEGNPLLNHGGIVEVKKLHLGISAFTKEDYSQLLVWKNTDLLDFCSFHIVQSLSFPKFENETDFDTWYIWEPPLYSPFQWNSSLTLLLGSDRLFGGGQFQSNASPDDPAGFSALFLGGISFPHLFVQNEIRLNSSRFVTSDLRFNRYPLLLKGKINYTGPIFEICNNYTFSYEKKPFPWHNRLWQFMWESELSFQDEKWEIDGGVLFSLFNDKADPLFIRVSLEGVIKRLYTFFYWQIEGLGEYDSLFHYVYSVEGGYESSSWNIALSSSLEIDKRIRTHLFLKASFSFNKKCISMDFSLEDIGLYNSESVKMKPSLFIGLELKDIAPF